MMKQTLSAIFVLILLPFVAGAQLSNGLVAHWNFDGNVNDATGKGHNGTANNITYGTGKTGAPNTAAVFNGTSSYIDVGYQSDLNFTKFTFCAVVKPTGYYTGTCQGNYIFERGTQYMPGSYSLLYFDNPYNSCTVLDTSKEVFAVAAGNVSSTNGAADFQYSPNIVTQKWYCVVGVFDGTSFKVYVDGVLKSTAVLTSGAIGSNSTQGLRIGAKRYGSATLYPYWLNAYLDDLRIYDRAFSASDVSQYCGLLNDTSVYISKAVTKTTLCESDTLHLQYGVNGVFASGNTFTAQLSDASGSFANPVSIGSVTSSTAGTIVCTMPSSLNGTGYRIRIVASNPSRVSADNGVDIAGRSKPQISSSSNSPICSGQTIQLNASSTTSGVSYSWTGPASFNSNTQNPSITSATTANGGSYYVSATAGGCSATDTTVVVVKNTPASPTVSSNSPVCTGGNLNLTATSTTSGVSYSWTGPSGFSSNIQNPVRSAAITGYAGTYYATATLNGCSSLVDSTVVTIINGPDIGIFPSPSSAVCDGDSVTFIAFSLNVGVNPTFQWEKNGTPISGANSPTYKAGGLVDGDKFRLRVTPGSGTVCNTPLASAEVQVQVLPYKAPSVSIVQDYPNPVWENLLVTFSATPVDAGRRPKYQWMLNGNNVQGANAQSWGTTTLKDGDSVSVEITSDYTCPLPTTSKSNILFIQMKPTDINDIEFKGFAIYPNPNKGTFVVSATSVAYSSLQIEVFSSVGQVVYKKEVQPKQGQLKETVNLSEVSSGVYLLRLSADGKQRSVRFMVK